MNFDCESFLPTKVLSRITDIRVNDPNRARRAAVTREQRSQLTFNGKLNIVAADHQARGNPRAGDDPLAMANRGHLLARLTRILISDAADGLLTTMDVLEDLLILHDLVRDAGGPAFLDSKVLIVSVNRGGLAGSAWELDDPWSGPDIETISAWRLDGLKLLLRLDLMDPNCRTTLMESVHVLRGSQAAGLPVVLEPLPVEPHAGGYRVQRDASALARTVGVATALGNGTTRVWLKLPSCDNFEQVARSTTLPILILGGEVEGDLDGFFAALTRALASGSNVRGTLIGRNALYPRAEDPLAIARGIHGVVHEGWSAQEAAAVVETSRGQDLDAVRRWLAP